MTTPESLPRPSAPTRLDLFADYHQLYVQDETAEADFGEGWTSEAIAAGFVALEDAFAIATAVNVTVAVTVEVAATVPERDVERFDHVVEASLRAGSGSLVVMGCTDEFAEAARFAVEPGWIRIRASRSNLAAATAADQLSDENPETTERLRLQVWPAGRSAPEIVKRWQGGS